MKCWAAARKPYQLYTTASTGASAEDSFPAVPSQTHMSFMFMTRLEAPVAPVGQGRHCAHVKRVRKGKGANKAFGPHHKTYSIAVVGARGQICVVAGSVSAQITVLQRETRNKLQLTGTGTLTQHVLHSMDIRCSYGNLKPRNLLVTTGNKAAVPGCEISRSSHGRHLTGYPPGW